MIIVIPTYKRKDIKAFSLIDKNPELVFTLAVRKEDYDDGFYDEPQFKNRKNINFMKLSNVSNIGDTRQRIVENSTKLGFDYCFMIDDTQTDIIDMTDLSKPLYVIIEEAISQLENDKLKDVAIAFTFGKRKRSVHYKYFVAQLCQAYIINLNVAEKYSVNFKSITDVGVEDILFNIDAMILGLVNISNSNFVRKGLPPCSIKQGGTHAYNETEQVHALLNYGKRFKKLQEYLQYYDSKGIMTVYFANSKIKNSDEYFFYATVDMTIARIILATHRDMFEPLINANLLRTEIDKIDRRERIELFNLLSKVKKEVKENARVQTK